MYQKIKAVDEKALESVLDVASEVEQYKYRVKKITINKLLEVSMYIKKLQVQLGKNISIDKKLQAFHDMYSQVIAVSYTHLDVYKRQVLSL